eukprot:g4332.t1
MFGAQDWLQFYDMSIRSFDWRPKRCAQGYEGELCGNCTTTNTSWYFVRSGSSKRDVLLPIIRQLISYCMLLGKIGSFQMGTVKAFRIAFHYVSEAVTGIGIGSYWFSCAVGWSFYLRLLFVAILPVTVAMTCFVCLRLVFCRIGCGRFMRATVARCGCCTPADDDDDGDEQGAGTTTNRLRCYMDASIVYLFYLAFPTVVKEIFAALACTQVAYVNGTTATYLTADFRVSCDGELYQAARAGASVLVATHVVLPPIILAVWIYRNRHVLQTAMAIRRVGFLYRGFKLDIYPWWGVVQLLTKIAIAAIVVFLDKELEQMVVAMLLFATLLLLQVALRPFATEMLNNLQALALLSLTVTQFVPIAVSSFYVANQQDREQVIDAGAAMFISVALVCLNSIVVVLYVAAAWKAIPFALAGTFMALPLMAVNFALMSKEVVTRLLQEFETALVVFLTLLVTVAYCDVLARDPVRAASFVIGCPVCMGAVIFNDAQSQAGSGALVKTFGYIVGLAWTIAIVLTFQFGVPQGIQSRKFELSLPGHDDILSEVNVLSFANVTMLTISSFIGKNILLKLRHPGAYAIVGHALMNKVVVLRLLGEWETWLMLILTAASTIAYSDVLMRYPIRAVAFAVGFPINMGAAIFNDGQLQSGSSRLILVLGYVVALTWTLTIMLAFQLGVAKGIHIRKFKLSPAGLELSEIDVLFFANRRLLTISFFITKNIYMKLRYPKAFAVLRAQVRSVKATKAEAQRTLDGMMLGSSGRSAMDKLSVNKLRKHVGVRKRT